MSVRYIHYGDDSFRPEAFEPVKNSTWLNKPVGGLWSSPIDAERGWKSWCEGEEFNLESLDKHFTFTLKDSARILTIEDVKDLSYIPMLLKKKCNYGPDHTEYWPDFEKIAKNYDAILFNVSKDYRLYWALYGWDCDTLLVLNPDVIVKGE